MNFSFPPPGYGGPVFNFRSEGRSFDESNRHLVSASAFFEFTRQEISKSQAPPLAEGFALHGDRRHLARGQ
jgi:putative SOS response-associated peptidase YedK